MLQNVVTKSFILLFLTTTNTVAKNQSALARRRVYYISAEFLIGKLLSNNLINLGPYDEVKKNLLMQVKSWSKSKVDWNHHLVTVV